MDNNKYDTLNNLEELLLEEEVKDENGVVSAYTVYKALKRYFDNVFFNAYDNYNLVSKINSSYTNKEIRDSRRKGFDSSYLKILDIRSNVYNLNRERDEIQITFIPFGPENRGYQPRSNVLYRKGKDDLFCIKYKEGFNFCDSLLEYYYDDFNNIFAVCEKHSKLKEYFKNGNHDYTLLFKHGDIMTKISFDYLGNVKYRVVLNDDIQVVGVKTHSMIKHLINDNEKELMERVPVNISGLSLTFQDILEDDLVKRGKARERKM